MYTLFNQIKTFIHINTELQIITNVYIMEVIKDIYVLLLFWNFHICLTPADRCENGSPCCLFFMRERDKIVISKEPCQNMWDDNDKTSS